MSEDRWQENLEDAIDAVKVLNGEGKEVLTKRVIKAYAKSKVLPAAAAVLAVPLVTGSGVPTISNIPARNPEEHIASQAHASDAILEGSNTMEDDLVSVVQPHVSDTVQVKAKARAQVQLDTSPQLYKSRLHLTDSESSPGLGC